MLIETGGDPDGGYNNLASDPGGATRWGVSQRAYPHLDVATLTREQALEIYREYWIQAKCDQLPVAVAVAHFDCAFLSGVVEAARILQRTVGAQVDGRLGPRTFEALRSFLAGRGPEMVAAKLIEARACFIVDLVNEPEKPRERMNLLNLKGWVVRLVRLTAYVSRSTP
ncbi:MAG: hypothetical protein A3E78_01875 [Alphaproteobacteria bacterium RIFCSPHIGHO2_12_FULL_63_12]|nr:MAG: hypothetical protein A3E78_01875 [Alphaproteobacteria bacterium RIFCSPHIGHO2_12_FULL_63_12]